MIPSKKRKLDDDIAATLKVPVAKNVRVANANGKSWQNLSGKVAGERALVLNHEYHLSGQPVNPHTGVHDTYEFKTSHTHGDFKTRVVRQGTQYFLQKHNIATSQPDQAPQKLDKLIARIGDKRVGATDALRVLKGTHVAKGLSGGSPGARTGAVELGTEVGISEYMRGGSLALINATSSLYLMKHGEMKRKQFLDPAVGYKGSGKGGAERLRGMTKATDALDLTRLKSVYTTHAAAKVGKPWSGQSTAKGFDTWVRHKVQKWRGREG